MKKQVNKGRHIVMYRDGKPTFAMKAEHNMIVEAPDNSDVRDKATLTKAEQAVERAKIPVVLPEIPVREN